MRRLGYLLEQAGHTHARREALRVYAETARHFAPLDPGVKPIVAALAEVPERDSTWKLLINEVVEVETLDSPRPTSRRGVEHAPWPDRRQVEQDLIICRALCDLFNAPALAGKIAFRGGTAIHKLLFKQPLRYSEDIDLVQTQAEPIGATVDAIRDALSWLGKCSASRPGTRCTSSSGSRPRSAPQAALKLKVEINTREHEVLARHRRYPFEVDSDWYSARTEIVSFEPEELFGTKLRALLQRRRNRDLFDLHEGLEQLSWLRRRSSRALTTIWRWRASRSPERWPNSACWRS